ncbi:MAG: hypothetical protein JKX73_08940 [Flavobacteriales bacterium]|nr:hypothetical protein [Flavobacteriales bacterium]
MYCRIKQFYSTLLLVLIASLATVLVANAQEGAEGTKRSFKEIVELGGYVKNMQAAAFLNKDTVFTQNFIHNRLNWRVYASRKLTFGAEMRNRLFYGESVMLGQAIGNFVAADAGYWNLSNTLINGNELVLHSTLDRLWINWATDKWDVRLGRQRINWGVNLAWNPNDLFNTYNFIDFDYEERPGSDGLRVTRYLKGMSSIEVAGKFSKNPDSTVVAGLYKFNKWGYDWQILSGVYYDDWAVGMGWAGNLGTAGLKGEATYFHPRAYAEDTTGVLSASFTVDYSLKKPIYVTGAMLYNSAGSSEPLNLFNALTLGGDLSGKSLMPTRFSYLFQVNGTIKSLTAINVAAIYGAGMNLIFLMPSVSYAIGETWDIMLIGQLAYLDYQDGSANAGNMMFLRTKWSF